MKALVIYGTRYGSATEISEEIKRVLEEENVDVDLVNSKEDKNLDPNPYDLVVVGSGIRMGKWTKDALNFLKKNKTTLASKRIAIFVTCGAANQEKTAIDGQKKYLDNIAMDMLINQPVATGLFGSVYDPDIKHGLLYKLVEGAMKKDMIKHGQDPTKRYDYRDWDGIRTWTRKLLN